jgi:hypothetical protein
MTLAGEAAALGYQGFDWVQQITYSPDPQDDTQCANLTCIQTTPLTAPWNDPPPLGYPSCYNSDGILQDSDCVGATPFYYPSAQTIDGPNDCVHFLNHDANSACLIYLEAGNTLNFYDAPENPNTGEFTDYLTELVGILPNGQPSAPLYSWTWEDNYQPPNTGGVVTSINYWSVDPGGNGGLSILSVNGQTVPEPPCVGLVVLGMSILAEIGRRKRRAKMAP